MNGMRGMEISREEFESMYESTHGFNNEFNKNSPEMKSVERFEAFVGKEFSRMAAENPVFLRSLVFQDDRG